jgi:predicted  nucleic acid-binding Zn-ribbon protein
LRAAATAHREQLAQVEAEQEAVRASLAAERAVIDAELATARERRAASARGVGAALLSRYERVMSRRQSAALFALNADYSCGACETAIPLQRRLPMSTGAIVEPCEGCGVLLFWRVPVAT